jgi:hypothetical protein
MYRVGHIGGLLGSFTYLEREKPKYYTGFIRWRMTVNQRTIRMSGRPDGPLIGTISIFRLPTI